MENVLKVSVVIPVYNPGEFITACVDALLDQSLSTHEYEVIFVDDGSTDDTPAYLDGLAADHDFITTQHEPNSGWPGRPRNVGTDLARGEYIFYCDHDDWLGHEALERLWDFATANGSDVVVGKMAGINRPVPQDLFARTRPRATLIDTPLMDSLTPHKLFRRDFLTRHDIRFPEGRRRLEDHYFVVSAYLAAEVISVYADYTCYYHIRRDDVGNAGYRPIEWSGYFGNLSEAVDVVLARTDPGPLRDRVLKRWLQVEMVSRLSGQRYLRLDPAEAADLFAAAHALVAQSFGDSPIQNLPPLSRQVARALLAGDAGRVRSLAELTAGWSVSAEALQMSWHGSRVEISGTARIHDGGEPGEGAVDRLMELLDEPAPPRPTVTLDLTESGGGARWPVEVSTDRHGLEMAFTADLDPGAVAAGLPLSRGCWDLFCTYSVLGLRQRRRVIMVAERRGQAPSRSAEPTASGEPVALYLAGPGKGVSLDVGLVKHPALRPPAAAEPSPAPIPPPPPPSQAPLSVVGRVRRWAGRTRRSVRRRVRRGLKRVRARPAGAYLLARTPWARPTPPVVSVVVATRHADTTLDECLDSILQQTLTGFEIVLVEFGQSSASRSRERSDPRDARIRRIASASVHVGGALAAGAEAARGRHLVFIRDTDVLTPRALTLQVRSLHRSHADFVVGAMDFLRDGTPRRNAVARPLHVHNRASLTLADAPAMLVDVSLGNVMFRRPFWTQHGAFAAGLDRPEQPAMVAAYLASATFDVLAATTCRSRLRLDPGSIVQERYSISDLRQARQAAVVTWDLLTTRADPIGRSAWLGGLLDAELGAYIDKASLSDQAHKDELAAFVAQFVALADDAAWGQVRMFRRVLAWLAQQGRWADVEALVEWVRVNAEVPPTRVENGHVMADLPLIRARNCPDYCYELSVAETRLDACLREVRWTDDHRLLIRGWAFVRGVDLGDDPGNGPEIIGRLTEVETGTVVELDVRPEVSPLANRWSGQRFADVSTGGFITTVDPAALPVTPGLAQTTHWQLGLTVSTRGLQRSGVVTAQLRAAADQRVPARDLLDPAAEVRFVPLRSDDYGFCVQRRLERVRARALSVHGAVVSGVLHTITPTAAPLVGVRIFVEEHPVRTELVTPLRPADDGGLAFDLEVPTGYPSTRWHVRAVDESGRNHWVSWGPEAAFGAQIIDATGTVRWARSTRGFAFLLSDPRSLQVRTVEVNEDEIVVEMLAGGLSAADLQHVELAGPLSVVTAQSVVAGERGAGDDGPDQAYVVSFPARTRRWDGPELPLVSGSYEVRLPDLGVSADVGPALLLRCPVQGRTRWHGWTVQRQPGGGQLRLVLAPPLADDERSAIDRTRIRAWYATAPFAPRESVLFQCFRGEFATDSQRAIHDELRRRGSDLELIWAVTDHAVVLPEGAVPVIINSRQWYAAMASSRFLCANIDYDRWFVKRAHQRYLQTFHGYPFKSMGASLWRAQGKSEWSVEQECLRRTEAWDAIVVPAEATVAMYRREYRYDGDVLVTGYPRDDSIFAPDAAQVRGRTRELLGVPPHHRVVLYAPTWRDTASTGAWTATMFDGLDLGELTRSLGGGYTVLVRGHNYVLRGGGSTAAADIVDVTSYPEINDLILAADVALLDYSSLRFDWLLTEKPVLFFVPDLTPYLSARTTLFAYAPTAPGPLLATTAEVVAALHDLDGVTERYADARRTFNQTFQPFVDGGAASRVIEAFFVDRPPS
ncbi:MAG: CDP-glycerol glycerophosphotransferase family protein [Propionibacteriaceae bacterium]